MQIPGRVEVRYGEDRDVNLAQHALGQRAEQKSFHGILAVSAHHDKVNLFVGHEAEQFTSDFADFDDRLKIDRVAKALRYQSGKRRLRILQLFLLEFEA